MAFAMMGFFNLVACAPTPTLVTTSVLRNPTVPLGGTSRFDPARFSGTWQTVACIGTCASTEHYAPGTDTFYLRNAGGVQTSFQLPAPGVLRETDGAQTLVVMWVDEGFRTAVLGDADGAWAAILNRTRAPASDRIKAATEILDFNGWDISKLRKVSG